MIFLHVLVNDLSPKLVENWIFSIKDTTVLSQCQAQGQEMSCDAVKEIERDC